MPRQPDNSRPFGVYIHVPFCATRCGYCDFNTYTATELGEGASQASYADTAITELDRARRQIGDREMATVYFGGGTPTLLPAISLIRILQAARSRFPQAPELEVTTEANPESVDPNSLRQLVDAGFTRISFGMQSVAPHVLATLDRRHTPGRATAAVAEARAAGFRHVNVDLIYGTPGERDSDWIASLSAAVDSGADHVSAYSLIVEPGTRFAARVARGELPMPDDDVLADRYLMVDELLTAAGFEWYEVSNWARTREARSRHNLLYWTDGDWWGVGPGAHSHVDGVRWWNVKHPKAYAAALARDASPAAETETLTAEQRHLEDVMLRLRLSDGLPLHSVASRRYRAATARADGLLDPSAYDDGRLVLTTRGRLLADAVVRDLIGA